MQAGIMESIEIAWRTRRERREYMDLYRIILVDDEEEVRKSIIKKIDWKSAGFCVVGDAENGKEALEKIEALQPDVLLTDIRMPYMDGLTLAERVRQKSPSIKIVIFSGYDDFEYAKQAIKLNVTEYILKPVNVEELTAILKKIKANLDQEIEEKRDVSRLRENYRKNMPILREQFLNELASHSVPAQTVSQRMQEYGIPLLGARKWVGAAVSIGRSEGQEDKALPLHYEQDLIPISVRQIIEEKLEGFCRFSLFNTVGTEESDLMLIAAVDENNTTTGLIDVLGDICREVRKILEIPITIGIGHSCTRLDDLNLSCQSALEALGYKTVVGTGMTIYINDVEPVSPGKLLFDSKDESELTAAVKFGPEQRIREIVKEIMDKMRDAKAHFRQRQAYMLGAANCIIQMLQAYDLDMEQMAAKSGEGQDLMVRFPWSQSPEDFERWLLAMALQIHQAMSQERDTATKQVIQSAIDYIHQHYQDPDLSVEQICRTLHLSPAYFSTIFKKETGQTYIAYLTEVRLNKAVELLRQTDDKTYVIAAKVGYQEQNYFSYVFKKRFGVSPTRFRGSK